MTKIANPTGAASGRIFRSSNNLSAQTWAIARIRPNPYNARTHSAEQTLQIANSMVAFGFTNPLQVSEDGELIAGHGRYQAAKLLGLEEVPVIIVTGLSPAKRRALAIADNKIAENGGWDRERLAIEIPELTDALMAEGLDISILGLKPIEINRLQSAGEHDNVRLEDRIDPRWFNGALVSKAGDVWVMGTHKLMCGDAGSTDDVARLMANDRAALAFLDPLSCADIPSPEVIGWLRNAFDAAASVSREGAVHFVGMDRRNIAEVMTVAKTIYGEPNDLAVWVDATAGQGALYSGQLELVGVFHIGKAGPAKTPGRRHRARSNVWHYAGVPLFREIDELRSHRKPVALFTDAIKDGSRKGDVVLDSFAGRGSVIIAAERVGRHARALEVEPRWVDVSVRRWQAVTGRDAIHAETGLSFDAMAADRARPGHGGAT
jgi:hypothetical protein